MDKDVFTTFEVGRLCRVYHTTVINWINKGQLKAYATPGRHRRIERDDLIGFMKQFNIRIPKELGGGKPGVMIVDDDKHILRLLKRAFESAFHAVDLRLMENGIEALVSVGKDIPDLIVLDVVMPGMDGIEVCKVLRSRPETKIIKIIAITGERLSDEQENFLRSNVDHVFKKPFSPIKLAGAAAALLGSDVSVKA